MKSHYLRSSHGCPVHDFGHEGRRCSCKGYWLGEKEGSDKAWGDHSPETCAEHGGSCIWNKEKHAEFLRNYNASWEEMLAA